MTADRGALRSELADLDGVHARFRAGRVGVRWSLAQGLLLLPYGGWAPTLRLAQQRADRAVRRRAS